MKMQSGTQIRLSSSVEISGTSDLSTIVYIDDDVLSFFGIPLSLEMIQEWFGNETTFIDLLNQGPDEIYDWAVSNIPGFAEDNSGLATANLRYQPHFCSKDRLKPSRQYGRTRFPPLRFRPLRPSAGRSRVSRPP